MPVGTPLQLLYAVLISYIILWLDCEVCVCVSVETRGQILRAQSEVLLWWDYSGTRLPAQLWHSIQVGINFENNASLSLSLSLCLSQQLILSVRGGASGGWVAILKLHRSLHKEVELRYYLCWWCECQIRLAFSEVTSYWFAYSQVLAKEIIIANNII